MVLDPEEPAAVRRLAARLGRAPSSVSAAIASMHEAGLLDGQRRPTIPELFWELAARWDSPTAELASTPTPGEDAVDSALRIGRNTTDAVGWALTETLAAAAYGAPVGIRSDHPGEFYVPDASTLRRAVQLLGTAPDHTSRRGTIRVAPVPIICSGTCPHQVSHDSAYESCIAELSYRYPERPLHDVDPQPLTCATSATVLGL